MSEVPEHGDRADAPYRCTVRVRRVYVDTGPCPLPRDFLQHRAERDATEAVRR